jgi:RHS repeat-associated protein
VTPTDRFFTNQRLESNIGLYDYRARFYDPWVGSFIQPDSIVPDPFDPAAWNRYGYVYGNPTNYTDPSGHCAEFGDDACWGLYERITIECPECTTVVTGNGIVPLHEANYDRLRTYRRNRIVSPVDYTELGNQLEAAALAIEIVISVGCEPCDWAITANYWRQGDFHPLDLAGLLPLIPSAARRAGKHLSVSGTNAALEKIPRHGNHPGGLKRTGAPPNPTVVDQGSVVVYDIDPTFDPSKMNAITRVPYPAPGKWKSVPDPGPWFKREGWTRQGMKNKLGYIIHVIGKREGLDNPIEGFFD